MAPSSASRSLPWVRFCAVAVLFGIIGGARSARAQTVTWTQTQIASVNGAMPSIAVDRLGYVHVGWTLGLGGSSYYAYHSTNTSGDYQTTLVDSKTSGGPTPYFPYLTTDSLGFFHMVWRDLGLTGSKPVLYRTNNPETRALVKMSFSSSGHTHDPLVDVTPDDIAHVVTEADSCTGCPSGSNLYDESFATTAAYAGRVTSLVQDLNDSTGLQQFSSVTTKDGTRHMVFSMRLAPPNDNQRLVYYAFRSPGSMTWSTPVSVTGHQDNYQGWPAIVADASNTLHLVYSSQDYGIYYVKRPAGGVWSSPVRINDQNDVPDAIPSITVDPNGRLHVVFQRYAGSTVALYYTTNAYDADNWLDPASRVLSSVGTFTLTHQNRKVAVNWVDGQVLVPYHSGTTIWLASTSDVPVTPTAPNGTSTVVAAPSFAAPATLNRSTSNTSATATTVMRFTIHDAGGDGAPTRVRALHFHTGGAQSFTPVAGKDEVLSYSLAGAQVITQSGQVLPALISDTKMVVRDVNQALEIPAGESRSFELQVWLKNVAQVTGKRIDLRFKPDQDVVVDGTGSSIAVDQPIVETDGMLIVDNNAQCPTGTACNDGNPCTHSDMCNNANVCVGLPVTCNSDPCNMRTCNGTSTCTVTPVLCGSGGAGGSGPGTGGMSGAGGVWGAAGTSGAAGAGAGGAAGSGTIGTGGMMMMGMATGGATASGTGGMMTMGMATGGATVSGTGGMMMMGMATGGANAPGSGGMTTGSGGQTGVGGSISGGTGGMMTGTPDAGLTGTGGSTSGSGGTSGAAGTGGGATTERDGSSTEAGVNQSTGTPSGCGCNVPSRSANGSAALVSALVLALFLRGRRRRA